MERSRFKELWLLCENFTAHFLVMLLLAGFSPTSKEGVSLMRSVVCSDEHCTTAHRATV